MHKSEGHNQVGWSATKQGMAFLMAPAVAGARIREVLYQGRMRPPASDAVAEMALHGGVVSIERDHQ